MAAVSVEKLHADNVAVLCEGSPRVPQIHPQLLISFPEVAYFLSNHILNIFDSFKQTKKSILASACACVRLWTWVSKGHSEELGNRGGREGTLTQLFKRSPAYDCRQGRVSLN